MTLKEIREAYEDGSAVVNQFNLKLLYAGIAIVWLLKGGQDSSIIGIPRLLLGALFCFCLSLFLHMIQAYVHTKIWYNFYEQQKEQKQADLVGESKDKALDEGTVLVDEKEEQSKVTWCFWHIKPIITLLGYILIGCYLIGQLIYGNGNKLEQPNSMPIDTISLVDTIYLKTVIANQDSIIKLLQPKPKSQKCDKPKTVAKKKTKKQPVYIPLDTINCDGKEFVLVEKVK